MTRNTVAANLLMLGLLAGGWFVGSQVKQEVFPEFDLDVINVGVPYPGASPAEVEQGIVLAIEEQVRSLDGVKRVTASAAEGAAGVTIELELGVDPNKALADVKSAIDRITSFPEDAEEPTVSLLSNRREVIAVAVYGPQSEEVLRQLAERVRAELLLDPNITYVELYGTRPREIAIEISQPTLRRYGLTLQEVARTIDQLAVELPAGAVKTAAGEILVRTAERRNLGVDFENLPIVATAEGASVSLGMIASVRDGFQDNDVAATFNGQPAVLVNVFRSGDETPVEVADAVKAYVAQITERKELPPQIAVTTLNDDSQIFRDRIDLLLRNAYLGLILVLLVLGLFLNLRLAFWVTMGIPTSFAGSLLLMPLMGVSINMISLFAFIVTLGIVVDDAIVVGENIYEMRQQGLGRMEAAITGAKRITGPVMFSVLTTITAFAPLLFVPGPSGKFFRVIPAVVICVLTISLVESLLVLPAHLAHKGQLYSAIRRFFLWPIMPSVRTPLIVAHENEIVSSDSRGIIHFLETPQRRLSSALQIFLVRYYTPAVQWVLVNRYLAAATGMAILIATVGYVRSGRLEFTFLPKTDSDRITAQAVLPFGAPVDDSLVVKDRLEQAAQSVLRDWGGEPVYDGVFSLVGSSLSRGGRSNGSAQSGGQSHLTGVQVFLVPSDERSFSASAFAREWRTRAGEIAGLESLTFRYSTGPGGDNDIEVELSHNNINVLEAAAEEVAEALSSYPGVKDIDDGFSRGKPQLDYKLTPQGRSVGLTAATVGRQVRDGFFGAEALRQQRDRDEVRVRVKLTEAERGSEYALENLILRTPNGGEVPLKEAATVERGYAYTTISRADGRRVVSVTAGTVPGVGNAAKILESMRVEIVPEIKARYEGLDYSFEGQNRRRQETLGALGSGFPLALLVIFALLAIPFRSYVQPIVIMAAIPFGLVGAVIGHVLMGYDLSLISIMGLVATSGIVVNDSLVLVHAANAFKVSGVRVFDAAVMASVRRFRPIILTSLTTFFGLIPMIAETSVQARFLIPMAISIAFGVMFSTVIILLLVPAYYLILEDGIRLLFGMPEEADQTYPIEGERA
ncbi:MAG: efflux RND transporter permease subunit [Myxococcales bacterium]|nr:efflux RND transporter permease subunit [Myxococcales bacterium]